MKTRFYIATLALAAFAAPVAAQEPTQSLPTIHADAILHVFDCANRSLPSQREVAEWTGQHNFGQVYDTRKRLMGEVARACNRPGTGEVALVLELRHAPQARRLQWVARVEPRED